MSGITFPIPQAQGLPTVEEVCRAGRFNPAAEANATAIQAYQRVVTAYKTARGNIHCVTGTANGAAGEISDTDAALAIMVLNHCGQHVNTNDRSYGFDTGTMNGQIAVQQKFLAPIKTLQAAIDELGVETQQPAASKKRAR